MAGTGGARPGAGRPPKELSERKRWLQEQAILNWTSDADAKKFWKTQLRLATEGDAPAAKLVASYLFGVPTQPIEMTGDQRLVIEYSNDWRGENRPALSASGTGGGAEAGAADELHFGRETLAENHVDDGAGG